MKEFLKNFKVLTERKEESLVDPDTVQYSDDSGSINYYRMGAAARWAVYGGMKLGYSLSEKLFGVNETIWKSLIEYLCKEYEYDIGKSSYLTIGTDGSITAIAAVKDNDTVMANLEKLFDKLDSYSIVPLDYNNGLSYKILLQSKSQEEGINRKPLLIVNLDFESSIYTIHQGFNCNDDMYILYPCPSCEMKDIEEFLSTVDIDREYNTCKKLVSTLDYAFINTVMSLHEVIDVTKSIGAKVNTDDNGMVGSVSGVTGDESIKLTKFFNSFNIPFKQLKKLNFLRKSLRFNSLTVRDMLEILANNFTSSEVFVNGYSIANMLSPYFSKESDNMVVSSENK
jgi:hypothetical protein